MRHVFIILVLLFGLSPLTAPALAEDITGAWSFKTDVKRKGCSITGNMSITRPDEDGIRTCSFVSTETCEAMPDESWTMEQACRITPQVNSFIIRSRVIATLTEGYDYRNYLPDHFIVTPQTPKRMTGIWQDKNFAAPVIFWRDDALPLS